MTKGIDPGQKRAHGELVSDTVAEQEADELTSLAGETLPEDRARGFEFTGFSRMRVEWSKDDRAILDRIKGAVDGIMMRDFFDAYAILSDIYDVVREPVVLPGGVIAKDGYGMTVWARSPSGAYLEDWSRLGNRQREDFVFRITTSIFTWQQRAADLWGEAMFAKAIWTERFAIEFDRPNVGTVDDRTARGNIESAEDRYFALFVSLMSRKADALCRSMELINQRIKDAMVANGA